MKLSSGIAEVFEAYCESEHAKTVAELEALGELVSHERKRQQLESRRDAFRIVAKDLREKCNA